MNKRKVRVGIVGVNDLSSMHEAGYAEIDDLCELAAFCDDDEALVQERAERYRAKAYNRYEDLLADPTIDFIDITTPISLLAALPLATLEAGKHLFLERPLAMTAAQIQQLHQVALEHQVRFTLAEYTRFVAAYQEAARLLGSEQLGDIRFIRVQIAGSEENSQGGTIGTTHSSESAEGAEDAQNVDAVRHIFYLLTWLFGDITDVHIAAYQLLPESLCNDHRLITGHLPNNTVFTLTQNCLPDTPWGERLEIHGSLGSLVVEQLASPPQLHIHGEKSAEQAEQGEQAEASLEPHVWRYLASIAGVQDVVRAIYEERPGLLDPLDISRILHLLEGVLPQAAPNETAISLCSD
jgi:predicted dehydrogenase